MIVGSSTRKFSFISYCTTVYFGDSWEILFSNVSCGTLEKQTNTKASIRKLVTKA